MTFLVLFDGSTTDFRVDPDMIVGEITAEWPGVRIDPTKISDARSLTWVARDVVDAFEAYLHSDGTCVYVDGQLESAADVAVWLRRFVPGEIDLIFCDSGYNFSVSVTATSRAADLLENMESGSE